MTPRAGNRGRRSGHAGVVTFSGLVLLLAGCSDAASPYRSVLREQTAAYEDLERILGTVTDPASMKSAQAELARSLGRYDTIKERAMGLTPPSFSIREQVHAESAALRRAVENLQQQVSRIKSLPGGEDFLKAFGQNQGFLRDYTP